MIKPWEVFDDDAVECWGLFFLGWLWACLLSELSFFSRGDFGWLSLLWPSPLAARSDVILSYSIVK